MKKLNIAFIVPCFPVTTETFIINQITDLIDKGHNLKIFSLVKNDHAVIHRRLDKYKLNENTFYLKQPRTSKIKRTTDFLKYLHRNRGNINFWKLKKIFNFLEGKRSLNLHYYLKYKWILDHGEFDIIHAHFGICGTYIAEMMSYGFFANTKLVSTFHGYDLAPNKLSVYKTEYKQLFNFSHLVTVNSPYALSLLKRITDNRNVTILPVGFNTQFFKKEKTLRSSNFTILFVGRLIPLKAPDLAVRIVKLLYEMGNNQLKLFIIGDGPMRDELKEMIIQMDLQDKVELKGALGQEEIVEFMSLSDIFLFPGIYDDEGRAETQGLVIQEAQGMELPVLVSDVGGMKYGLINNQTGYVLKENDIQGFADKIIELIRDKNIRKMLGRNGREFVIKNFDSNVLGKRLEKHYYSLISRN